MKCTIFKPNTIYLLLFPFCATLLGIGCEKERQKEEQGEHEEWEWSDPVEGYICGTFICLETDSNGIGTNIWSERGFCILLEGSENMDSQYWPLDFYTLIFL